MLPKKFAFVDIETTGARVTHDRIIEIGIVRVENGGVADEFETLINPERTISDFIENLTGISKNDVLIAPTFWEVKDRILDLLSNAVFVAHNARFDYGFLRNEFRRYEHSFTSPHLCTVKLSRLLYPNERHHNLDALIERFQLQCARRHRAMDDCRALWEFYKKASVSFSQDIFEKNVKVAMKQPSLPINLSQDEIQKLPESPGIYIFYGEENVPLYIGKSVNIKYRVLSHFANDHSSATEMSIAQQIQRIKTIQTAGELGALLLESDCIKDLSPLYNRKLRMNKRMIALRKKTIDGYDTVAIEIISSINAAEIEDILGICRSKKQAKDLLARLAYDYNLCNKLLGIESTKKSCFLRHLGICRGACTKRENALSYNARFLMAFSKDRIKKWPFNGPVVIQEKDDTTQSAELFIVDKWCLLGSVKSEGQAVCGQKNNYVFNLDTYKILASYIFNSKSKKNIRPFQIKKISEFYKISL